MKEISGADDFELHVHEHGFTVFDVRRLSNFGRTHGGRNMAIALVTYAKVAALIILLVEALALGNTKLGVDTKSVILLASMGAVLFFDFVVFFLYLKFRYAALCVGIILGLLGGAFLGVLALTGHLG